MYSKVIKFEKFLPNYNIWIKQSMSTTADAVWLHLQKLNLRDDVKQIVVTDVDTAITLAVE